MKKVLVAFQNKGFTEEVRSVLAPAGYRVTVCHEAAAVRELILEHLPSVLILDAGFGKEVFTELHKAMPRTPIIAWLGEYHARIAVDFLRAGATECIVPPVRALELVSITAHVMNVDHLAIEDKLPVLWSFKRTRRVIVGIALFLVLSVGVWAVRQYRMPLTLSLPYRDPTAVVYMQDGVWMSNWYTQSIYKYVVRHGAFVLKDTYYFSDFWPLCMAYDGFFLWTIGNDLMLRQHVLNEKLEVHSSFQLMDLREPVGMVVTDTHILVSDATLKKVFRYSKEAVPRLLGTYAYELPSPMGLVWNERGIWIADAETNRICRFAEAGSSLAMVETAKLPSDATNNLAAFFLNPKDMYVVHAGKNPRLVRYHYGAMAWKAQKKER